MSDEKAKDIISSRLGELRNAYTQNSAALAEIKERIEKIQFAILELQRLQATISAEEARKREKKPEKQEEKK